MNTNALLHAIQDTSAAIRFHRKQIKKAAKQIHDAIVPPEPYLYFMPVVAFFIGFSYAKPLSQLFSISSLYRYGLLLTPLLKE